jgi:hypothetical protein
VFAFFPQCECFLYRLFLASQSPGFNGEAGKCLLIWRKPIFHCCAPNLGERSLLGRPPGGLSALSPRFHAALAWRSMPGLFPESLNEHELQENISDNFFVLFICLILSLSLLLDTWNPRTHQLL